MCLMTPKTGPSKTRRVNRQTLRPTQHTTIDSKHCDDNERLVRTAAPLHPATLLPLLQQGKSGLRQSSQISSRNPCIQHNMVESFELGSLDHAGHSRPQVCRVLHQVQRVCAAHTTQADASIAHCLSGSKSASITVVLCTWRNIRGYRYAVHQALKHAWCLVPRVVHQCSTPICAPLCCRHEPTVCLSERLL